MLDKISQRLWPQTNKQEAPKSPRKAATRTGYVKQAALLTTLVLGRAAGASAQAIHQANGTMPAKPGSGSFGVALRDLPQDATPATLAHLPATMAVAWSPAPRFISGHQFAVACLEGAYVGQHDQSSVATFIQDIDSVALQDAMELCIDDLIPASANDGCLTQDGGAFSEECLDYAATQFPDEAVNPLLHWTGNAWAPAPGPGGPMLAPVPAPVGAPAPK